MTTIDSFVNRLKKIGVEVRLCGNYPWIYMDSVNGKKVLEKLDSEHYFTVFFTAMKVGHPDRITDISEIFKTIRKYL